MPAYNSHIGRQETNLVQMDVASLALNTETVLQNTPFLSTAANTAVVRTARPAWVPTQ